MDVAVQCDQTPSNASSELEHLHQEKNHEKLSHMYEYHWIG